MLTIRLQKVGRKHEPVFRLVLTDSKNGPRSGKFLEILGSYDARRREDAKLDTDKIKDWVSKGAQLSGTVHNFLIDKKVIDGKKINVLPKKKAIVSEKPQTEPETSPEPVEKPEVKEETVASEATETASE